MIKSGIFCFQKQDLRRMFWNIKKQIHRCIWCLLGISVIWNRLKWFWKDLEQKYCFNLFLDCNNIWILEKEGMFHEIIKGLCIQLSIIIMIMWNWKLYSIRTIIFSNIILSWKLIQTWGVKRISQNSIFTEKNTISLRLRKFIRMMDLKNLLI